MAGIGNIFLGDDRREVRRRISRPALDQTGGRRDRPPRGSVAALPHHGGGSSIRRAAADSATLPYRVVGNEIDWREILAAVIDARRRGGSTAVIARAFHRAFAGAMAAASRSIADEASVRTIVLSGGAMQNDVLKTDLRDALAARFELWTNRAVPPNDGGISLGQAALAAFVQGT
ncbi:MAG TPA: hypothetical protein VKE96_24320 [Vicinamibacterales bacterium]|nr:hypothetical protein [Vicinamibacterales bacterium]